MGSHTVYIWGTCEVKTSNKNVYIEVFIKQMYALAELDHA